MPDTATSPGHPLSRDTNEHRAGAPRRTSPGETAAPGIVRAGAKQNGRIARAERVETRWRDIQWVDFTSEPDSGMNPAAPPLPAAPSKTVGKARGAAQLGNTLQRFAAAPQTVAPAAKSDMIPGLAPRFTRLPVPRLTPARAHSLPPQPIAPTAPPSVEPPPAKPVSAPPQAATGSVVVYPRVSTAATSAPVSPPLPAPPPPREIEPVHASEPDDGNSAFPASISTHVSDALSPAESKSRAAWRTVVGGMTVTGGALRVAATAAAATSARGLAGARQVMLRRAPQHEEPTPSATTALFRRATDRISHYVAARENRLRVSGMAALAVVAVALAAYIAGVVLAHVTQPDPARTAPRPAPASPAAAAPHDPLDKQLALADKIMRPESLEPPAEGPAAAAPPADPAARAKFYMERAKAGDAEAQYDIGVLYAQGQGLVQDYASAANWFHAAAARGNVAAQYNLGVLYAQGLGVPANQTEAINWYRSAADREHPEAQFNLALAYASGSGTKQDYAAAARWYQRAAAHGLAPAMINLAILYETGNGVERSPVDAYAWYSAAGERGDAAAKTRAGALFQQFNDPDKARAEGLAATIGAALDSFNKSANTLAPPA